MVDDLWSADAWEVISRCLPENNRGSRIIVATRFKDIVRHNGYGYFIPVHDTLPLDDTDARKLLYQRTFGDSLNCPDDLKDVSDKILRKCGGLPLALVSVGNMLANMPRTQEAFESFLQTGAFFRPGLQGQASSQAERMRHIIGHTYNNLPADGRACMLYLSIFPEEYAIKKNRLMRLWITEGFIRRKFRSSISLDSKGTPEKCIEELIGQHMIQFQPSDTNDDVNHKFCVVHPVIRDFIVWQAMEENFVTIAQAGNNFDRDCTVQRLSIFDEVEEGIDLSHACSITVFGHTGGIPPLTKLSVVRVLDLEDYKGPVCLDGLCELVLLRYLSLRGTDVSELPENIGDLRSLETLDVRFTKVKELPPSIVKLENLLRLFAGNAKLPNGIGNIKALRTLSCAIVGNSSASVMEEVGQIGELKEVELFCNPTKMSADEKQDTFLIETSGKYRGFPVLEVLRIHSSFPSLTFKNGVFRQVKVLELKFESMEPPVVSGIMFLPELTKVLLHQGNGPVAFEAVSNAARLHTRRPNVEQVQWEECY